MENKILTFPASAPVQDENQMDLFALLGSVAPDLSAQLYGYTGNNNDLMSAEDRAALAAGRAVSVGEGYTRHIYFSAPYSDGVRLVYSVYQYDAEQIRPGVDPSYAGFMVGHDLYTDAKPIAAQLAADVAARLLHLVPDEETAARLLPEKNHADRCTYDQDTAAHEAARAFYTDTPPRLVLCSGSADTGHSVLIQYILTPDDVVKANAATYLEHSAERIYTAWANYNRIKAAYDAITADPSRPEHALKAMASAVTEEKTIRLRLVTGEEIRAEARAVKCLPYSGRVSSYDISAADRLRLLDERRRPRDIKAAEIAAIMHGSKTLWTRNA